MTRARRLSCGVVAVLLFGAAGAAMAGPARRVVSVNITSDEILLALAPERVVALSVLADEPEVSNVTREAKVVAARVKADPERILDLRPDLVVIGGQSVNIAAQLEPLGIRVIRIQGFESIEWIEELVRTLGDAVGARDRAEKLIAAMRDRLDAVRHRVATRARPRVLTYAVGGGASGRRTTFDAAIDAAGGENLAATLGIVGWKRLSLEQIVNADPDVIVMSASQRWAIGFQARFLEHPALRNVRAVRGGHVHLLPGRLMVTASHYIVETVEELARRLHPDAFAQAAR